MTELFEGAVSKMDAKGLLSLRAEFMPFIEKMQPRIDNDLCAYYTTVDAGIRDAEVLACYKERVALIDSLLDSTPTAA